MYEAYWKLERKPFDTATGAEFYYPGESHQGALLKLRYAIENRRGGAVLSGAAGLGKSLLIGTLFRQLPSEYDPRVHVVFPQMPPNQLLAFLADEIAPSQGASHLTPPTDHSIRRIRDTLSDNTHAGRHAIVVVDEAHLLDDLGALETMRMLLNFETDGQTDFTLLLVGQPQLLVSLDRAAALEERLGVKCLLRPFSEEETVSYVMHRLTAAGATHNIFDNHALKAIHGLSQGVPRRINRLCDLALLIGFAEEQESITSEHVESVAEEMVTVTPE